MRFWEGEVVQTILWICGLMVLAAVLRVRLPPLRRLGVPDSIVAGVLGFALGPTALGALPLDTGHLEVIVYHGLALTFATLGLQGSGNPRRRRPGAVSYAFALSVMPATQGVIGLVLVLLLGLQPGFGLLLPLSFSQGPGQALSLGTAWEALGFTDGGQIGLTMAALGYAFACLLGVPLVALARRRGWVAGRHARGEPEHAGRGPDVLVAPGALDPLMVQVGVVGVVYLATWLLLSGIAALLPGGSPVRPLLFGFHFIVAALLAIGLRRLLDGLGWSGPLDDALLGRVAGTVVDFITAAALAAVQVGIVLAWWKPILVVGVAGGLATAWIALWVGRRAFPDEPFEHAITFYGAATGTMPTGMALLRMVDPDLHGQAAGNYVRGSAGAMVLGAPLLAIVQFPLAGGWGTQRLRVLVTLGILAAYVAVLLAAWRRLGPLRFLPPLWKAWPDRGVGDPLERAGAGG